MRDLRCAVIVTGLAAASLVQAQDRAAAETVAEMRRALGGDAALDAVRVVRGAGTSIRALGALRVSGHLEILLALPDRYLRTDGLKVAGLTSTVVTGVSGREFLQRASGPDGMRVDPAASLEPAVRAVVVEGAARGARHDLVRLLIALLGAAPGSSLAFTVAGTAEAPEWTAEVLQVDGADGFTARLFVDAGTRLPRMMSWEAPDTPGAIRRLTASFGTAGAEKVTAADLVAQAQSFVEHRLYFTDYRRVGELTWPHRLRRTAGNEPIEEIAFERFWINPPLDADAFDPDWQVRRATP